MIQLFLTAAMVYVLCLQIGISRDQNTIQRQMIDLQREVSETQAKLQKDLANLEMRPYLSLDIEGKPKNGKGHDTTEENIVKNKFEWTVKVNNSGKTPAIHLYRSIVVVADGESIDYYETQYLWNAVNKSAGLSEEALKGTESQKNCTTNLPHAHPVDPQIYLCVDREGNDFAIGPGEIKPFSFTMSGEKLLKLLNAKDKFKNSGLFITLTYEGMVNPNEVYVSRSAFLPYHDPDKPMDTASIKLIQTSFK